MRFEALAAEGTLEALTAACDLYRDDLLSDVGDLSPEYEDWLLPERERLRDLARISLLEPVLAQAVAWQGDGGRRPVPSATLRSTPIASACMRLSCGCT